MRATAPPPKATKQAPVAAPAREPPRFEDYYQEEPIPKRGERLFESFTTEQQVGKEKKDLDDRNSFASQAPQQQAKK